MRAHDRAKPLGGCLALLLLIGLLASPLGVVRVDARGRGTEVGWKIGAGVSAFAMLFPMRGMDPAGFALLAHSWAESTGVDTGEAITTDGGQGGPGNIDTTGAKLLIVAVQFFQPSQVAPTLTDNKGNAWANGNVYGTGGSGNVTIYYCIGPTSVGAGHNVTATNAASGVHLTCQFAAFSGGGLITVNQQNGSGTALAGSSVQPGSVTTSASGELQIAAAAGGVTMTGGSIDSGFTVTDTVDGRNNINYAGVLAYLVSAVQTTNNPTTSWSGGSADRAAAILTFRNH